MINGFDGNAFGTDFDYVNDGRRFLYVPQGGFSRQINDRWAFGATIFSAGLGPDLRRSPYERYGSARRFSFFLFNSGISLATGYRLNEHHNLGFSLNLGYQQFSLNGLEFVDNPAFSETPGKVTNQGKDGSFNVVSPWAGPVK